MENAPAAPPARRNSARPEAAPDGLAVSTARRRVRRFATPAGTQAENDFACPADGRRTQGFAEASRWLEGACAHLRSMLGEQAEPRQLLEVVNKSLNAIMVHRDGRLLFVNEAFVALNGYASMQEALQRHRVGVSTVHPDDKPLVRARIRAREAGEEDSTRYEFRLLRPDGRMIWVECLANRIVWNGEPALLGIYHDISNRKQAEEALRRSERLFSTVFAHSPDAMMLSTLDEGRVIDVNEAFLRFTGKTRAAVIGCTGTELGLWSDPAERPAIMERLRRTGRLHDLSHRLQNPAGEWLDFAVSAELLQIDNEELVLFVSRDVTERRKAEARIAHMAHHDPLTGLANRVLLQSRLERGLRGRGSLAVLCLDLDRFKEVNDTFGHPVGDMLLQQAAGRLCACVRDQDTVARLGGDEFAIVQPGGGQPASALRLANRILRRLSEPFILEGREIRIGACVGVAVAPRDGSAPAALLRAGDLALYRAKANARGTILQFDTQLASEAGQRGELELALRSAVAREEFDLYFQPLVNLRRQLAVGCEALLRWRHPERGLVGPDEFIRLAEETGLILPIGRWVLRRACMEAATWPDDLKVAVNISPAQIRQPGLIEEVRAALAISGLRAGRLELEVTESVVLDDSDEVSANLRQLKQMGVSLALDDFGTGYSSMAVLTRFPFDRVKIDRSFIAGLGRRSDCTAIVRAVLGLCGSLNLEATAEGVETADQLELLRAEGLVEAQGYLFGPPRPAEYTRSSLRNVDAFAWSATAPA